MELDDFKSDYDWREAFGYAGQPGTCAMGHASVYYIDNGPGEWYPVGGGRGKHPGFHIDAVKEIIAASPGENDGPEWLCLVRIGQPHPNRAYRRPDVYLFLKAGCDYTGWTCQAGGCAYYSRDLAQLVRWGIGTEDLRRLEDTGWLPPGADTIAWADDVLRASEGRY